MDLKKPSLGQLRNLVAKWQERLNLRDWTLTEIRWATEQEEAEDNNATCEPEITYKSAKLVFLKPKAVKFLPGEDYEYLVVHELLHLHHAPFQTKEGTLEDVNEENIVHSLTTLLLALERGDETILRRKLSKRAAITPRRSSAKKSKAGNLVHQSSQSTSEKEEGKAGAEIITSGQGQV